MVVDTARRGLLASLSVENCTLYHDQARFIAPHEIRVGSTILKSERIFINVGGRARSQMQRTRRNCIASL